MDDQLTTDEIAKAMGMQQLAVLQMQKRYEARIAELVAKLVAAGKAEADT